MEKTGKWIRNFLGSNKKAEKEKKKAQPTSVNENQSNPSPNPPKVKRGWSFRRSSTNRDSNFQDPIAINPTQVLEESARLQKQHAMVVAVATAAAADAAVAAAQAAAAMIRLTSVVQNKSSAYEAAAIRIQAAFRSYLARKALCALRGLVKFQALVRGYLVRKQATTTIRCMQALLMVQVRARARRLGMIDQPHLAAVQRQLVDPLFEMKRCIEEKVKILEIDLGESKGSSKNRTSYSNPQPERPDPRFSSYYAAQRGQLRQDQSPISPAPSAITDHSRGTWSKYFEDYSFMTTTQSSPHYFSAITEPTQQDLSFLFNQESQRLSRHYMANTESSRAKARSQSAPKQRLESCEKMTHINSRRPSIEGSNIPRSPQMQRSGSHLGIDYSLRDLLKIQ